MSSISMKGRSRLALGFPHHFGEVAHLGLGRGVEAQAEEIVVAGSRADDVDVGERFEDAVHDRFVNACGNHHFCGSCSILSRYFPQILGHLARA